MITMKKRFNRLDADATILRLQAKMLCSCYDAPDPPDLSEQAAASEAIGKMQQQTAADQLAWAKEQDAANRQTLNRVLGVQLPIMEEQYANAKKDRARYEQTFQPLEDNLIKEFQNYDTPERRDLERGRAIADVNTQFDAQRRNALQRLESYGVDPSQTRNAALDLGTRVQQAASQASAANNATRNTENTGRALRAEAINIGKGMPSQVAGSYGQSIAAGQAGVGGANQTTGTSAGALTSGYGAMGQALQGYGQSANINSQNFGNQMTAFNANSQQGANALSGLGSIAGMAMMMREGGHVPRRGALPFTGNGPVDEGPTDGSGIDDQVPARLSVGEFVIPADVVEKLGTRHFEKLIEKYHTPAEQQDAEAHANGGWMGGMTGRATTGNPAMANAAANAMRNSRMSGGMNTPRRFSLPQQRPVMGV